jgi:IS30 family transposase
LALHNKKIKARREKVSFLLSRSFTETEIAHQLNVDRSTINRDVKVLKSDSQQFVYDLAKSDLAYYFKKSLDGIEEAKRESWKIFYNDKTLTRDKLLALKLVITSEESRFRLLTEGPGIMAVKSLNERVSRIEEGNNRQQVNR